MSTKTPKAIFILRHNIAVENDVELARSELAALADVPLKGVTLVKHDELKGRLSLFAQEPTVGDFLLRAPRPAGTAAFEVSNITASAFDQVVRRASFIQEAALSGAEASHVTTVFSRTVGKKHVYVLAVPVCAVLEYSAYLLRQRDTLPSMREPLDALLAQLLYEKAPPPQLRAYVEGALDAKKTTLYLSHELHLYKGKFFPRLVRSLINRYAPHDREALVCDPFVGSGTALLEAALLGHQSLGLDVDPTSVMISQHKTLLAHVDVEELREVCELVQRAQIPTSSQKRHVQKRLDDETAAFDLSRWETFKTDVPEPMRSRLKKRGAEEGYDLHGEIVNDSAIANCMISQMPRELGSIFRVCLSHALTKKLRLRFVGIGNGRFTFDVAKVRVLDLFKAKAHHMVAIAESFAWLRDHDVPLVPSRAVRASALELLREAGPESVDLIVTSPPYIPASSGREHYARARAIPLVLTGAASEEELSTLDAAFVGEMRSDSDEDYTDLPPSIQRTLTFLKNDKERKRKYLPTLQYYRDIEQVLEQSYHVLRPGASALFVVAKSHTFYIHKTKEIVHTVEADKAFADLATQAGFDKVAIIDVPLQKSGGLNARPRSTDEYAEAVIVLRKPGP